MVEVLISFTLAFGITFYAIPAIIHASDVKKLFDYPDDRKIHPNPIPSLGGLGIFAGFITAFLLTVSFGGVAYQFQYLVASLLVMFFVGIKDDLLNISPFKKFLGQLLAAAILVFKGGWVISSMDGILGIYALPPMVASLLTMITIVLIINAYNLIDGVDGLAAGLGMVSSVFFAVYFGFNGDIAYSCMSTALFGSLAAFLIFNAQPARIFMGDTGSMFLGLLHAVLALQFIQTAPTAPVYSFSAAPMMAYAIMFVPLFDTLRVFSFRILQGNSPFTPDRNHIHHIILKFGLSHKQVSLILSATGAFLPLLAVFIQPLGSNWAFILLNVLGFSTVGLIVLRGRKTNKVVFTHKSGVAHVVKAAKTKVRSIGAITGSKTANNL